MKTYTEEDSSAAKISIYADEIAADNRQAAIFVTTVYE